MSSLIDDTEAHSSHFMYVIQCDRTNTNYNERDEDDDPWYPW